MLEKPKIKNFIVWKSKKSQFKYFETPKTIIRMFGEAKIHNCNVLKRQNLEFQCLEKPKFTIPMFGKAKNKEFQ